MDFLEQPSFIFPSINNLAKVLQATHFACQKASSVVRTRWISKFKVPGSIITSLSWTCPTIERKAFGLLSANLANWYQSSCHPPQVKYSTLSRILIPVQGHLSLYKGAFQRTSSYYHKHCRYCSWSTSSYPRWVSMQAPCGSLSVVSPWSLSAL